jgi:cob(I)alamin adenosyltransferase
MGNRLSKIVTRTGDDGTTGLADGERLPKDSLRVVAMGDVDELNATLGLLLAQSLPDYLIDPLKQIQHDLFTLGGELSMPRNTLMKQEAVTRIEDQIEALNADLPPLKEFILPGGGMAASCCHLARTVCRRAERQLVALDREERLSPTLLQYLNRLSDLLFIMCRVLMRAQQATEELWENLDPYD